MVVSSEVMLVKKVTLIEEIKDTRWATSWFTVAALTDLGDAPRPQVNTTGNSSDVIHLGHIDKFQFFFLQYFLCFLFLHCCNMIWGLKKFHYFPDNRVVLKIDNF